MVLKSMAKTIENAYIWMYHTHTYFMCSVVTMVLVCNEIFKIIERSEMLVDRT